MCSPRSPATSLGHPHVGGAGDRRATTEGLELGILVVLGMAGSSNKPMEVQRVMHGWDGWGGRMGVMDMNGPY